MTEIFFFKLRGGTTTKIDGTDGLALQVVAAHRELLAQSVDVALLQVAACGRVEVAIDAPRLAERDVDIDACHGYSFVFSVAKVRNSFGISSLSAWNIGGNGGKFCFFRGNLFFLRVYVCM